jgi:hypothetical protein
MERAYCKHQHVFHVPKKEAKGIHMGNHALAFGISFTAYMLARRWYIVQILLIKTYNNVNIY